MYKALFSFITYFLSISVLFSAYSVNVVTVYDALGTGVVEITADGRTGPYTVIINSQSQIIGPGSTTTTFNNISFGNKVALIENVHGCIVELPFTVSKCALDIYFFFESNFDILSNSMIPGLHTRGLLPGQTPISNLVSPTPDGQPYNQAPWNYAGIEGAGWTESDYATRFPDATPVDWTLLTVIDTLSTDHTELYKVAGIVDVEGRFHFACPNNLRDHIGLETEFYIRIEHRNHMGVLSPSPYHFSNYNDVARFDFRIADSYRVSTSVGQIQLGGSLGSWGMLGGDTNQSDFPSYDITGMDKTEWFETNGTFDNYLPGDMNLDGDVNGMDKAIWFQNNGKSSRVPKN